MSTTTCARIDLNHSCVQYSNSVKQALGDLLAFQFESSTAVESVRQLDPKDNLYFSILFTGQTYGEFLISLDKKMALTVLGHQVTAENMDKIYFQNRDEIIDSLKEIINIAAATTLSDLKSYYPDLSITPPRAIEGALLLSSYDIKRVRLNSPNGSLSCLIYLDHMRLDVADTIEKQDSQIKVEKAKQEELRQVNKAKGEFLANMSHELRTPLNGMIGMLEVLKTTNLNETQKVQFDVVYRSGEFLLSLITDILEFSRIDAGKLDIDPKPFHLRECVETIAESLAIMVFNKGLEFNVLISPELDGSYIGDKTRLKQILINLIGNAVKFTPTGSVTLMCEPNSVGQVNFRVLDTGVGIPEAKLDSIFESFSQADTTDNRKYGGAGLGLTISKKLAEAMGGKLTVQSQEAKGSEFTLTLPLKAEGMRSLSTQNVQASVGNCYLLTEDQSRETSLLFYLQKFCAQKNLELVANLDLSKMHSDDVLFIDFRSWQKYSSQQQSDLAKVLKDLSIYTVFLTLPTELQDLMYIQTKLNLDHMHYMPLPVVVGNLTKTLQNRPTTNLKTQPTAAPEETPKVEGELHALIVEDNEMNQKVIAVMLKTMNISYEFADHGKAGLDMVSSSKDRFDFILMDCQMPVMNGYDATQQIRALSDPKLKSLPIIALTASAFRETKEACFECGMDDFLTKPIRLNDLKTVIDRVINRTKKKSA